MKTFFKISLLLNLGLLGGLIWLAIGARPPAPAARAAVVPAPAPDLPAASPAIPRVAVERPEPAPFRWRDLDSTNYHAYVKNLRNIGCPEPSLRAIVTADVEAAFGARRQALEQELAAIDRQPLASQLAAFQTQQTIQSELRRLPDDAARMIDDFLGLRTPASVDATATAAAPDASEQPPAKPVNLPVVFNPVDFAALGLTDDQMQIVDRLQQNFLDKVGTPPDPNDTAAVDRWQKAALLADASLHGMLGNDVYSKFLLAELTAANRAADARNGN